MPTMIKVTNDKAEIRPGFKDRIRPLLKDCFVHIKEEADHAPTYSKKAVQAARAPVLKALAMACNYPDALDTIYTRLRALPYRSYDIGEYGGNEMLALRTKPIIAKTVGDGKYSQQYDLGEYTIYITRQQFIDGVIERIHMIPEADPLIRARHMHHHLISRWDSVNQTYPKYADDLFTENAHTCWGDFPNVVMGTMSDGDLVEFTRVMLIFLTRLNIHSPLESISSLTFAKEVK